VPASLKSVSDQMIVGTVTATRVKQLNRLNFVSRYYNSAR